MPNLKRGQIAVKVAVSMMGKDMTTAEVAGYKSPCEHLVIHKTVFPNEAGEPEPSGKYYVIAHKLTGYSVLTGIDDLATARRICQVLKDASWEDVTVDDKQRPVTNGFAEKNEAVIAHARRIADGVE